MVYYIGIDDTDNAESRGTGWLARQLAKHLSGLGSIEGVTRHQFLVHPDIPFTSHNSGACIVIETEGDSKIAIREKAIKFLEERCAPGSDPGLCISQKEQLGGPVLDYAKSAQVEVLEMQPAWDLASHEGIHLSEHGGNGQGIIGALSACALRASGTDGRFIDLKGVRQLGEIVTVAALNAQGINNVFCDDGNAPVPESKVITHGWIRPYLKDGNINLKVQHHDAGGEAEYEIDLSQRKKHNN